MCAGIYLCPDMLSIPHLFATYFCILHVFRYLHVTTCSTAYCNMHAMCLYTSQICHNQIRHIWANISDHQGQAFEKASGCSVIQEVHHIKVNLDFPGSTVNGAYIPHQDVSNPILIREIYI